MLPVRVVRAAVGVVSGIETTTRLHRATRTPWLLVQRLWQPQAARHTSAQRALLGVAAVAVLQVVAQAVLIPEPEAETAATAALLAALTVAAAVLGVIQETAALAEAHHLLQPVPAVEAEAESGAAVEAERTCTGKAATALQALPALPPHITAATVVLATAL